MPAQPLASDLPLRYVASDSSSAEMPLVLCLHGRGADANDLADLAPMLGSGYRFVFPQAPRKFEPAPGYSFGWTWFDGWPPLPGAVAASRRLLLDFIDAAVTKFPTPAGKVILSGFSQGGLMSLDCGFRTRQPLAGIVVLSGALYEDELPPFAAQKVLIAHGLQDDVIPVTAARRTRLVLEEHGLSPEYHELPMGHAVSMEEVGIVKDFLARCLAE
jgi:phospholipase/carboxylesterase